MLTSALLYFTFICSLAQNATIWVHLHASCCYGGIDTVTNESTVSVRSGPMTELHSAARPAGDRADIREQRGQPGAGDDLPGERGHRRHHQAQGGGRETDHRHAVQGHHLQVGTTGSA